MEFLDKMPKDPVEATPPKIIKKPADGFDLEIGTLIFTMGDVDLEIKDVKVRDMDDFKRFIFEAMDK